MRLIKSGIFIILFNINIPQALAGGINPEKTGCDPFRINCRGNNAVLTKYRLSELQMLGSIVDHKTQTIHALIKAPDAHIYGVEINSPVGIEGGHVIKITTQQITIQDTHLKIFFLKLIKGRFYDVNNNQQINKQIN